MQPNIQDLVERIKLPPMSFDLLHKLGDMDCDLDSVAESISLDPSLTATLLRICNNAVFGSAEPVSTVAEAISRAGFKSVYMLAAALYGNGCFTGCPGTRLDTQRLWRHSITAAFNAKFVAESAGLDANSAFTAGLLHDLGKIVFAQMPSLVARNFHDPGDRASLCLEAGEFGLTHAEVGATLLERWKLPPQLVQAVRHHHHPIGSGQYEKFVAAITIGNVISHTNEHPEVINSEEYADAFFLLELEPGHLKLWREELDASHELVAGLSSF